MREQPAKEKVQFPNLQFLKNQIKCTSGYTHSQIVDRKEDYHFLEVDHSYIQWISPNYFKSRVNNDSYALTVAEMKKIRKDVVAFKNYQQGIQIFFNFMGLRYNEETNQMEIVSEYRLDQAINKHLHNRLRIRRVLASLLAFKKTKWAISLCDFLRQHFPGRNFSNIILYEKQYRSYDIKFEDGKYFDWSMVFADEQQKSQSEKFYQEWKAQKKRRSKSQVKTQEQLTEQPSEQIIDKTQEENHNHSQNEENDNAIDFQIVL